MKLAAYPKCFERALLIEHSMTIFEWIEQAQQLDTDGLEMHSGFLTASDRGYLDSVRDAIGAAGFVMPMLCHSPDFTHPEAAVRQREIERQMEAIAITRHLGGPGARCRVLSGQRYPQVAREQGIAWVVEAIEQILPIAREQEIVLAMENHYKDGAWAFPEFAQKQEVFLQIIDAIAERDYFGVQYDPSNAIVAGDDPIELLEQVADRVVSMHASDRWLAEGTTLEELRQSDGTIGYSPNLRHGQVGKGLNDYDRILQILIAEGYDGWISIEDGLNGLDEMQVSLDFLRAKIQQHQRAAS